MFTKSITHTHPQLRWGCDQPHLSRSWILEVSVWLWSILWFCKFYSASQNDRVAINIIYKYNTFTSNSPAYITCDHRSIHVIIHSLEYRFFT